MQEGPPRPMGYVPLVGRLRLGEIPPARVSFEVSALRGCLAISWRLSALGIGVGLPAIALVPPNPIDG